MAVRRVLSCMAVLMAALLCACTSGTVRLNQDQQALADQLFAHRDQWEVYRASSQSYYCLRIILYKMTGGPEVDCYYSDKAQVPTEAGAAFVFEAARAFYLSQDSFQVGSDIDPANFGKLVPGKASLASATYSVIDDDTTKRQAVESLFRDF